MKKAISLLAAVTLALGIFMPLNAQNDKMLILPKQVINGDAENSTYGWRGLFGDETTVISNVELDGNRVIKVEPKGEYASPMFNIGPAIIRDTANGYYGGGAGEYKISFRFKPENAITGDKYFSPSICCAMWNKITVSKANDWAVMKSGSDWTTITKTFTVTDDHLNILKTLFDAGNDDAYFMYLRLDGSGNRAFADGLFNYYIDDFSIEKVKPAKEVVNGSGEKNNTENWDAMNGTVEAVTYEGEPAIKFTPTDAYGTPKFDIGPAVFNDSYNGYYGGGAGIYRIQFKVKQDEKDGGQYFRTEVRSFDWNITTMLYKHNTNTYAILNRDEWVTVTRDFEVNQADLDTLKSSYAQGKTDAYRFYLRLNGTGDCAFKTETFSYYLKDYRICKLNDDGSVPEEFYKAIPVKNGDAELGTLEGWSVSDDNGTVENVPLEDGNAIKFTPSSKYGFPDFDIRPAILQTSKTNSDYYNGSGAGWYSLKFKIKAVNAEDISENGEEFSISLAQNSWTNLKNISNIKLTKENAEDWMNVNTRFCLDESTFEKLNANNLLSIRINGSDKAFDDGMFAYYLDDILVEKIKFTSFAPTVANDFTFDYKVKNFPVGNASVKFSFDGQQTGEILYNGKQDENGAYVFSLKNVTPLTASKKIVATLTVEGDVADEKEFSLEDYCNEMITASNDAYLRRLLADLLCYCRATQDYVNISENLTDSQTWIDMGIATLNDVDYTRESEKKIISDCTDKKAQWKSASLVLKNNVAVRLRFNAQSADVKVGVTVGNGREQFVSDIKYDGNMYYVDFNDLYASQFLEKMTVKIYSDDTQISNTLTYSVYSYAKSKNQDSGTLGNLVDSIMNYGYSAQAYKNK